MTDQRPQPESAAVMPTAFTNLVGCRVPVQLAAMGRRHHPRAGPLR